MPSKRTKAVAGRGRSAANPVRRPSTRSATAKVRNAAQQEPDAPQGEANALQQQPTPMAPIPSQQAIPAVPGTSQQQDASVQQPPSLVQQPEDIISISREELANLLEKASSEGARKALDHQPVPGPSRSQEPTDVAKSLTSDLLQGEDIALNIDQSISKPPQPKFAMTLALDLHVPASLRAKILNNEFVYLSDLLIKDRDRVSTSVQLSKSGQLFLQSHPKKIVTIDQWNEAFNIYSAIYCKKYTESYTGLLKHATNVRHIHSRGGDWQSYDQQYRLFIQSGGCNWGDYNPEIYNNAMMSVPFRAQQPRSNFRKQSQSKSGQGKFSDRQKYPLGYCWLFLDGKQCKCDKSSPDARKHVCPRCNQKHPLSQCKADNSNQNTQSK